MIPARLIRTVPAATTGEVEEFWQRARDLHPTWDLATYRDPIDPAWFPLTAKHWDACQSGAQRAGLIRLEALWHSGGVYIDSDVELYRPLDVLRHCAGFGLWEDPNTVPDFVLAAEPNHPAIKACLDAAIACVRDGGKAWASGPGVCTKLLPGRNDFLLLPPASFAPYHYNERHRRHEDHKAAHPYSFGAHHWHHSWIGH